MGNTTGGVNLASESSIANGSRGDLAFRALAILSFITLCWVISRSIDQQKECLQSEFVVEMQTNESVLNNCSYESRLSLQNVTHSPSAQVLAFAERLAALDVLASVWSKPMPQIKLIIDSKNPFDFSISHGQLEIGEAFAQADGQLERGVVLALLNSQYRSHLRTAFENEVTADFLLINVLGMTELQDAATGDRVSFKNNVSFALTERGLNKYCNSSWRSLSHFIICSVQQPGFKAHDISSWGARPMVAKILTDVYQGLGLSEKVQFMQSLFAQNSIGSVKTMKDASALSLALWTVQQSKAFLRAWGMETEEPTTNFALQRALMLQGVFNVTQWDATIEIANVPQWEVLWLSIQQWSQLHRAQRILVWSPIGLHAFPGGSAVTWTKEDVRSQKHVLVACKWPKADAAVAIESRNFVALQVCDRQAPNWSEVLLPSIDKVSQR